MKTIVLIFAALAMASAQSTTINGNRVILGSWDAGGATQTKPFKIGTTVPATCDTGDAFFKSDATAGQNVYLCTNGATDTWTQVTGGGGLPSTGGTGVVVQTGASTTAARTFFADSNELLITNADGVAGNPTFSFATNIDISTRTFRPPGGNTRPGTCTIGRIFFDRDEAAGLNLYGCTATDVWTLLGDGGGTPAFNTITTGTNTTATMTVGAGGTLTYSSTGVVNASTYRGNAVIADADVASTLMRDSEAAAAFQPLDADLTTLAGKTLAGTGTGVRFSTGSFVNGNCVETDVNGNFVDAGDPCGTGGSGATAVAGLTDNRVTVNSTIYTIAAGSVPCLDTSGVMQSYPIAAGTVDRTTGTTAGTIKFGYNCNGGSPVYVARIPAAITLANYTCTGVTCTSSDTYAEGDWALADAVVGGSLGTPTDRRSLGGTARYIGQNGVTIAGDKVSANCAYVGCLGTAASWTAKQTFGPSATNAGINVGSVAGDPSAPANGDIWYDSTAHEMTARINGVNVALGAGGGSAWGGITGTLSSQTDLQSALDAKLALAGGTMTGQLVTDNLGIEFDESDTNPTCAAGNFNVYADLSENKLKKCQNGTASDLDTGGSPAGSDTELQLNNTGAFGGATGYTYNTTSKIGVITSAASGAGHRVHSTIGVAGGRLAYTEACLDTNPYCARVISTYGQFQDGSDTTRNGLIYRSNNDTMNIIHLQSTYNIVIGGSIGVAPLGADGGSAGWMSVSASGAGRFANAATAGRGLVSIQGSPTELTGQTGDVAASDLLATGHTPGMYRVCGIAAVTAAGTGASAVWTLSWRSPASGTNLTHSLFWSSGVAETDTFPVNAVDEVNVCKVIRSTGGAAISLNPGDMNTATYTTAWTVERLR